MNLVFRTVMPLCVMALVSGCAMLPGSGPREPNIHRNATASLKNEDATLGYEYVVVDVTRAVLPLISVDEAREFRSFGVSRNLVPSLRLGPGDIVRVTVFESQTGGLFLPEEAGARPGNFVQLPPQRIDQDGRITVPFAGIIQAAGQTPASVEAIIRQRLQDRAIEPEIAVEIVEQNFSRVSVVGDVRSSGVFPLREGGVRVLEAIARAGGIAGTASGAFVTLRRDGRSAKVAYRNITESSAENIFLAPGDVLEVSDEEKTFFAFGATGLVGNFRFAADEVTLNEAVARVASLQENQADPRQVLIYRTESRHTLERMGVDLSEYKGYEHEIPTIYRANYRAPDIFFLANKFQMRNDDVIFVTNAAAIEFRQFFNNATSLTGQPLQVRNNIRSF